MAAAAALIVFGALAPAASAQDDPMEELSRSTPWSMSLAQVPPHVRHHVLIQAIVKSPRFADTYAGLTAREDGGLTVHATRSGMPAIAAALERELGPPDSGTYELRPAKMSYKALEALTQRVAHDVEAVERDGVDVFSFGPDPASNTVRVDLADYTPARAKSVTARFGEDVSVVQAEHPEQLFLKSNRYFDEPLWFNGDAIFVGEVPYKCTYSYTVRVVRTTTILGMTAGHCSGTQIRTHWYNRDWMGSVSTNYYDQYDSEALDVKTFKCPECYTGGRVYYEPPGTSTTIGVTRKVAGVCTWCGIEQNDPPRRVAMDGAGTGEVAGNDILDVDRCFEISPFTNRTVKYWRCNLSRAMNSKMARACAAGDSGGPVYQRTDASTNMVYAAGTMVGGNAEGWLCVFHDLHYVLTRTNAILEY